MSVSFPQLAAAYRLIRTERNSKREKQTMRHPLAGANRYTHGELACYLSKRSRKAARARIFGRSALPLVGSQTARAPPSKRSIHKTVFVSVYENYDGPNSRCVAGQKRSAPWFRFACPTEAPTKQVFSLLHKAFMDHRPCGLKNHRPKSGNLSSRKRPETTTDDADSTQLRVYAAMSGQEIKTTDELHAIGGGDIVIGYAPFRLKLSKEEKHFVMRKCPRCSELYSWASLPTPTYTSEAHKTHPQGSPRSKQKLPGSPRQQVIAAAAGQTCDSGWHAVAPPMLPICFDIEKQDQKAEHERKQELALKARILRREARQKKLEKEMYEVYNKHPVRRRKNMQQGSPARRGVPIYSTNNAEQNDSNTPQSSRKSNLKNFDSKRGEGVEKKTVRLDPEIPQQTAQLGAKSGEKAAEGEEKSKSGSPDKLAQDLDQEEDDSYDDFDDFESESPAKKGSPSKKNNTDQAVAAEKQSVEDAKDDDYDDAFETESPQKLAAKPTINESSETKESANAGEVQGEEKLKSSDADLAASLDEDEFPDDDDW